LHRRGHAAQFFRGARPATFFDTTPKPIDDQAVNMDLRQSRGNSVLRRRAGSQIAGLAVSHFLARKRQSRP
jgi:hypothetical protein